MSTESLQPNGQLSVGGRIGGSVGIPPDFLHIGRTRQIFAVLFARRGRYTKLLSAPIMGGNENAVPYGQASHSERFRRHLYSLRVKPPSCKAVAKKPFILTGCRDERRRIL
ncbi:putative phage associated protein [Neisseria gonorrhoeae NCCP11945]|uniref:Putative phage associated protein n=1 Tax=Neisseria gonorrhoeae (strain NCCP11945) TaxID=521006 RepID=B4RMQ2_NEIG2|nr:putative phage associated protein [Neisseria gonorrhoeae NCCP11945]